MFTRFRDAETHSLVLMDGQTTIQYASAAGTVFQQWRRPGVISRGNAWEHRSHSWKRAGTHGNGVPTVKVFKNAHERNAAVKDKETFIAQSSTLAFTSLLVIDNSV